MTAECTALCACVPVCCRNTIERKETSLLPCRPSDADDDAYSIPGPAGTFPPQPSNPSSWTQEDEEHIKIRAVKVSAPVGSPPRIFSSARK